MLVFDTQPCKDLIGVLSVSISIQIPPGLPPGKLTMEQWGQWQQAQERENIYLLTVSTDKTDMFNRPGAAGSDIQTPS